MLARLLCFELKLQASQVGFWVTCVVLFAFGILITGTDLFSLGVNGGERVKTNGAINIAQSISALGQLTLFFAAVFTVTGVMRDDEHKAIEIVHATPVKTFDLAFSRMLGVFSVTFICLLVGVLGMFVGQFMPSVDAEAFGEFNPLFYLQPILLFLVINSLLVSSIYIAVATITRRRSLVYVSAVALFMLLTGVGIFIGENSADLVTSLADPFGGAPLQIITQYWTAVEKNQNLVPIMSLLGLNRLLWLAVAIASFGVTLAMYKRGLVSTGRKTNKTNVKEITQPIQVTGATTHHGSSANLIAFFARAKMEYLAIVKSIPFLILSLIALAMFVTVIYFSASFTADPTLPTSATVVQMVMMGFGFSMLIITVFFGSDIIWRERTVNIHEIVDATPVKNAVLLCAKWIALFGVILTLVLLGIIVGMIGQTVLGDVPINPWTYLKVGLVAFALAMLVDAVAVLFIQNFMPGRVIGMLVAGALSIGFSFLAYLPFYHPLMNYGTGMHPGAYSEINGFNGLTDMGWWSAYWIGLILLLLVASIWLFRRGTQTSLRARIKGLRAQIGPATSFIAVVGLAGFIGFGSLIYKRLNIDQNYRNAKASEKYQVKYEQDMKQFTTLDLPRIRRVELNVNLKPSNQEATVSGTYQLENASDQAIETVYVSLASGHTEDNRVLTITGAIAELNADDAALLAGYQLRRFKFEPALLPGQTATMEFETYFHSPRFGDGSPILKNGTFLNNTQVLPNLGVPKNFMYDPDKRRKYKLPEREKRAKRDDLNARANNLFGSSADYVDFKATMCTDADQIAIAPGTLINTYEKNDQACRDYEANRPILNFFSFVSQDYAQVNEVWSGTNGQTVDVAIYYHEAHNYNVPLMMTAAKSSLDIYTQAYGPYLYEQLRIMEFPYGAHAQAFAGTIPFSENIGFIQNPGDPDDVDSIDSASYVTMHEIAHQWFAHQLVPADVKGFNVVSEGLTENAALHAYEKEFGWAKARRLLDKRAIQVYLTGRTMDSENELPLALGDGKAYQDYAKASWVFWGLRQTVGADKVNGAMKSLIQDFGSIGPPYVTTIEVVDYLKQATEPEFHQLISDYWDRVTFWDLTFAQSDINVSSNADGTYRVSFDIGIDKLVTSAEDDTEVSVTHMDDVTLDELVEVGFYTEDPTKQLGDGWFAKERIRLSKTTTTLAFDVAQRPTHVLLDPARLLFERNVKDNLIEVSQPTPN